VVCLGRDGALLQQVAERCGGTALVADLRVAGAADRAVQESLDRHGRLDGVVANAGIGHAGPVAEMTAEQVAELVDVNVRAPLQLARAAVAAYRDQPPGRRAVCFVSSIAGAVGVPGESVYSATKAAVEAFAVLLREEVRDADVQVSTVLPGVVDTDFFRRHGVGYARRFPRPVSSERMAEVVVSALERGTRRRVEPRWLAVPARLSAAVPGPYRALARRLS
jgi:short-subunit dehydrogenase